MVKKLVKRYGYLAASFTAAALVFVSSVGTGTYSWLLIYQPEPPK